jgi:hypothetical protein
VALSLEIGAIDVCALLRISSIFYLYEYLNFLTLLFLKRK